MKNGKTSVKRLLRSADEITASFHQQSSFSSRADESLLYNVLERYKKIYDESCGGFGDAPKFPVPHNLLFLLQQYQKHGGSTALEMVENTLQKMYAGGLFDHIGYGFYRYSTDRFYLIPHFEKMLYDNALLILAYCKAYMLTGKLLYKKVAEKTAFYILTEMTASDGGFYSAQDADSDGEEGKYYTFTPNEIIQLLGQEDGAVFNNHFNITSKGNFEGKSHPNLLHATDDVEESFDSFLPKVRDYRQRRTTLHTDDKILTSWNALMIAALCMLYKSSRISHYLEAAEKAQKFIEYALCDKDTLYVSFRNGTRGEKGFLDDYACYIFSLICLYDATFDRRFLKRAEQMAKKAITCYYDVKHGGFYFYGKENER